MHEQTPFILVPIHLDSLCVAFDSKLEVAAPTLDFTRLDDTSRPYLGESLTAPPMSTVKLDAGVHLHWALPDALTKTISLPLVQLQAFKNTFGINEGRHIWQKLLDARWLIPQTGPYAKVIKSRPERSLAPPGVEQEQLPAINEILDRPVFPAVPNRWLVFRYASTGQIEKTWMVESDYAREGQVPATGAQRYRLKELPVAYPTYEYFGKRTHFSGPEETGDDLKYCFLGRSFDTSSPPSPTPDDHYLPEPLTAVSYGDPAFAALYPNCHSVFGFWDQEKQTLPHPCTYSVLGYFSNPLLDYFDLFKKDFLQTRPEPYPYIQLLAALKEEFQWFFPIEIHKKVINDLEEEKRLELIGQGRSAEEAQKLLPSGTFWNLLEEHGWITTDALLTATTALLSTIPLNLANALGASNEQYEKDIRKKVDSLIEAQLPTQTLYYAQVIVDPNSSGLPREDEVVLTVGNTGTEAVSAFLADQIAPDRKPLLEDYLEALQLNAKLKPLQLDLGPKFEESRHEKGFQAVSAGALWTIRNQTSDQHKADVNKVSLNSWEDGHTSLHLSGVKGFKLSWPERPELNGVFWISPRQMNDRPVFVARNPRSGSVYIYWHQVAFNADRGAWVVQGLPPDQNKWLAARYGEGKTPWEANWIDGSFRITSLKDFPNLLNDLNLLQQRLDQITFRIEFLRQQIFADWCRYLQHENSLEDEVKVSGFFNQYLLGFARQYGGGFSDQDNEESVANSKETLQKMRRFIEWEIEVALKKCRQEQSGLQQKLADAHQQLKSALDAFQGNHQEHQKANGKNLPSLVLQAVAAPRYWQAAEPVLLLTGLRPSPRHGFDGRMRDDGLLACRKIGEADPAVQGAVYRKIEMIKNADLTDFGFEPSAHWHPIFIDWAISYAQAKNNYQGHPDRYRYVEGYLTKNYTLGQVDFSWSGMPATNPAVPFSGRSILTPSSILLHRQAIVRQLVPAVTDAVKAELKTSAPGIEQFKNWAENLAPKDQALIDLVRLRLPAVDSDEQQVVNWISKRLADFAAGTVPGLYSWYWQKVVQAIRDADLKMPDPQNRFESFLDWASDHIHLKKTYYREKKMAEAEQYDLFLENNSAFTDFLKEKIGSEALRVFFEQNRIAEAGAQDRYLNEHFNELIHWYQARVRAFLHQVLDCIAYRRLFSLHGLAQSMGGFNKALIALSQSYQLNIADPRADDDNSKHLSKKVQAAVQGYNRYSPIADGAFAPVRAGRMTIDRIHLIDNFGRYWPPTGQNLTDDRRLIGAETLRQAPASKDFILNPRLAEPARLNFRWLAAQSTGVPGESGKLDLVETNAHPASSPVCGWLLPNQLDNSLMVYDHTGQALGYIEQSGRWRLFPGQEAPVLPQEIGNPHLRRVVQRLSQTGLSAAQTGFIPDFISILDTALANISPATSAQHDALSLLMGRPIALVRAAISLEHRGGYPVDQSAQSFREEVGRFSDAWSAGQGNVVPDAFQRNTFGVEQVKIPLRLGEYRQLNDGLIGYWIDEAPAEALPPGAGPDTFFAPQSFNPKKTGRRPQIMTHEEDGTAFQLHLTLGQKQAVEVSILLDPRGVVHATCGLLPAKNIHLPADHYQQALMQIEIAFLSTPVLSLPGRLHLSLPQEAGYGWSWMEKNGPGWKTISSVGAIQLAEVEHTFPAQGAAIWNLLTDKGWIAEKAPMQAWVIARDQRQNPELGGDYQALLPKIEDMLERTRINPFDLTAAFSGTPEIREGWLKLTRNNHSL